MSYPDEQDNRKRDELLVFGFICVVLFPVLSVAIIGGYGFAVWMSHAFGG